ncbi:hypothetical protein [Pontimicrobium sp. IMCC45349]|uniref:hypothetical protein n=1 Tax=Pontimicrobium sp. IMCC45349 TaxID=3391574 RepID=UPI0039A268C1
MKNFIFLIKKPLVLFLFLTPLFLLAQTTHTVNNNPDVSTDFTDLQSAINAASAGDILYVQHSPTSYGNVTLNKDLTIVGRSHSDAGYTTSIGTMSISNGASNATVTGCDINSLNQTGSASTIDGLSFFDNDINSFGLGSTHTFTNLNLQGNVFRSTFTLSQNSSNVTITNNLFFSGSISFYMVDTLFFSYNVMGNTGNMSINNYATTNSQLNISNCIFVLNANGDRTVTLNRNGTNTIQVDDCVTYNYNNTYMYNFETDTYITINANVQENTNPLFTNVTPATPASIAGTQSNYDPLNDDLTLQGGSPVNNDGLYQGYNFINLGIPTGYPSIKILSHDPTIAKNGNLSVTIEAKTN